MPFFIYLFIYIFFLFSFLFYFCLLNNCFSNLAILYGLYILDISFLYLLRGYLISIALVLFFIY